MMRIVSALVVWMVCTCADAPAQTPQPSPQAYRDTIRALLDSLKDQNDELALLQHMLEASTVDPRLLNYAHVKSWIIGNPVVRDSLFEVLASVDSSVLSEAGADASVLSTYTNDIIEVKFGTTVFKGLVLRDALKKSSDRNLYKKIIDSYEYSRDIELRDVAYKLQTPLAPELMTVDQMLTDFHPTIYTYRNPHPVIAVADLSLYSLGIKAGPMWGAELRMGNDVLNLPFWTQGTVNIFAVYKRYKLGVVLPLSIGRSTSELIAPLILWGRKLNGARGIQGEFDLGPVGAMFSVTRFSTDDIPTLTDEKKFYFMSGVVYGYYSFGVALTPNNLVRAKVGFGMTRVDEGTIIWINRGNGLEPMFSLTGREFYPSPHFRIEYVNKGVTEKYSASIQFFDMTVMFTGSIEILPGILSLEGKYVYPMGDKRPWETPNFFIISPRLLLKF